jgi:hypothetical protein
VESSQNIFEVYIESADGKASVDLEGCLINLSGSGIVESERWDGSLSFRESISAIYLGTLNPNIKYKDTLKTTFHSYVETDLIDNYKTIYFGKKQPYDDIGVVSLHDKNPTTFNENHKKLHFSFGGLNLIDDLQIVVEEEPQTETEET